jgi:D-methionine transport system substrate-binding protein
LDANYFQHIPYLESFSKDHNLDLTYTAKVHIEPMGIYSEKINDISELEDGAEIAIPNDPTNGGRALILLEQAGLLKIKEGVGITATVYDIVENPKNLKITELEAATLPRVLGDVAAAVINSNYALEAKFVPTKDALVLESPQDNPYVNILAIRKGDENRPEIVKLSEALNSPEVKKFIEDEYQGAVIPAF